MKALLARENRELIDQLAFANVLPAYLAAAAVWTVGSMLAAPPNAEVIAELAPAELRARLGATRGGSLGCLG